MPEVATLTLWELIVRVLAAAALGGLIGVEREFADQPAGFRTHILVSLGAALFTLVGAYGVAPFLGGPQGVSFDPTRVAAQVVTGIGFLGAGAILRQGFNVRGLTTAAALWVTAAVGMAAGLGYWAGALATTATTVVALYGLKHMERRVLGRLRGGRHRLVIEMEEDLRLSDVATVLEARRARTQSLELVTNDDGSRRLVALLKASSGTDVGEMVDEVSRVRGVKAVELDE